jgi:hypothetical protein
LGLNFRGTLGPGLNLEYADLAEVSKSKTNLKLLGGFAIVVNAKHIAV